jgi:putative two-component system response regulator
MDGSSPNGISAVRLPRHRGVVLVVDDNPGDVSLAQTLLQGEGYTVFTANNGRAALEIVAREQPDVVLSDVLMPEPDGFEVCREIKRDPVTRLIPVVLITGLHDLEDRIKGIDAGADDFLAKPFNFDELTARVRSLMRLKRFTDELDSAESVITSLALTIEARDQYTEGHCERLAEYSTALGAELGLPHEDLSALQWGGYLHDVGKIAVSDSVLHKPARLTLTEFQAMKQHTVIGERLCGELHSLRHVLTTQRPYRPPMTADQAFSTLQQEVERGWRRRDLVDAFIDLCQRCGFEPKLESPVAAVVRRKR